MTELEQIELSIENAKTMVRDRDDLVKLKNNRLFKTLILEKYFKDEAHKLVLAKAEAQCQEPELQASIDKEISAIGYLNQYFNRVIQLGDMAERSIADAELERDELLAEEGA